MNKLTSVLLFFLVNVVLNAQSPQIVSFRPISAKPNDIVTIKGSNFSATVANNMIFFGAAAGKTITASKDSLTVYVPFGATYGKVGYTNLVSGLTAISHSNFNPIFSPSKSGIKSTEFNSSVYFKTLSGPSSIAVGDVDNDGKPEVIVANESSSTISIHKNVSSSGKIDTQSFKSKVDFPLSGSCRAMAIADLNGDGKQDLVIANWQGVSILINNSKKGLIDSSSFLKEILIKLTNFEKCITVAAGDISGNGRQDIIAVTANSIFALRNVSKSTAIDDKSFLVANVWSQTGAAITSTATLADLDGDRKLDLAIANQDYPQILVMRNVSTLDSIIFSDHTTFSVRNGYKVLKGNKTMLAHDINGDNKQELIVLNGLNTGSSGNISVLPNKSNPGSINSNSFGAAVDFNIGDKTQATNMRGLAMGDLDGDGRPDLVLSTSAGLSVLANTSEFDSVSSKCFGNKVDFAVTGGEGNAVAIGDLDGDGMPELIATNLATRTFSVLRNKDLIVSGTHAFIKGSSLKMYPNPVSSILNIELEKSGVYWAEIISLDGRKITAYTQGTLDLGAIANGVYIIRLFNKDRNCISTNKIQVLR